MSSEVPALESEQRRTYLLTIVNGSIAIMSSAFFAVETVLAGLVESLTQSSLLVGLMTSVATVGWMWPQLLVGHFAESLERKKPLYVASSIARVFIMMGMALSLAMWQGSPLALYWVLLALMLLFSSAGGVVTIPFMDIIAKGVPKTHLPTLWAWRRAVGGILGFGASVAAAFILSRRSGLSYPYNYAVLFALGAFFNGVGYFCFARVRERPEELPSRRASVRTYLRRGVVIFQRDRDYRRLYLFRVAWAGAIMSQAILVPFAVQRFGASPSETGGWFTAVILLVGGVSALVWGRGARIHGEVAILRTTSLAIMLCPLLALLLSLVAGKDGSGGWVEQMYLPFFMVMLAFSTIGINGFIVGWNTYLLALPPAQLRPSYLAFINTLTVPLLFAPALAGFIAEQFSYPAAFGISTVSALLAAVLAGSLHRRGEENHAITSISEADACTDA